MGEGELQKPLFRDLHGLGQNANNLMDAFGRFHKIGKTKRV